MRIHVVATRWEPAAVGGRNQAVQVGGDCRLLIFSHVLDAIGIVGFGVFGPYFNFVSVTAAVVSSCT